MLLTLIPKKIIKLPFVEIKSIAPVGEAFGEQGFFFFCLFCVLLGEQPYLLLFISCFA